MLAELLGQLIVLPVQRTSLLLERLDVLVSLLDLLLQVRNLAGITSGGKLLGLLGVLVGTLVLLDSLLKAKNLEDHDVGSVQNQGQEQGEAAEVHVALGVELSGLDLQSFVTHDCSYSITTVGNGGKFDLDPVDPVDTVDKENEDEDERDLQPILQFCDQWVLRNEGKHSPLDGEWHGEDEEHEQCHLCHEQHEHQSVVERHLGCRG